MVKAGRVKKKTGIRLTASDVTFHTINYAFLFFTSAIMLFPLLNVVAMSLSSPKAVISGKVWLWPVDPTIEAYLRIGTNIDLMMGFGNSLFYASFGTLISVTLTIMAAYPISRKSFIGAKTLSGIFVFTMLFSGGLIPLYLVVKSLNMLNTRWAILIPNALSVYYLMIARTFFKTTIPDELYEAADLDGASDIRVILNVVLPLSKPIIAVLCLFYAVDQWNSFFSAFIYLRSKELYPLQVVLRNILLSAQDIENSAGLLSSMETEMLEIVEVLKYAIIVFASLPVLIIYPLVQRYFVKGVMLGSLKG